MRSGSGLIAATLFPGLVLLGLPSHVLAQGPDSTQAMTAVFELPDAPAPQIEVAEATQSIDPQSGQAQNAQQPAVGADPNTQQPATGSTTSPAATGGATQNSSSSQNSAQQPSTQETQHQKAEQQLNEEEHQRIAGIVPSFNVSYDSDAVSLTPAEKFRLDFRSIRDPYTFAISTIVAGLGEAEGSNSGFGWGPEGFTKRAAAAYADNVIGNTLGNAVLPSLLHQDPRYFRLGRGSAGHRLLYAFATSFICKHDNTGKWEPNYSNVLGNMIGGEISTLYYPKSKSDPTQAIETGLTVTFEGTFGATLQEFWPDISRKFLHKDPTHGLDAQAAAQDKAWYHDKPE
jgi:hypothetical protein